jgi:hypothetical protein
VQKTAVRFLCAFQDEMYHRQLTGVKLGTQGIIREQYKKEE